MTQVRIITLPTATDDYDRSNEEVARRTVEQAITDINVDIQASRNKTNKQSSLAIRRFQFLMMGAASG